MAKFKVTYVSGESFEEDVFDASDINAFAMIKFGANNVSELPASVDKIEQMDAVIAEVVAVPEVVAEEPVVAKPKKAKK